MRGTLRLFVIAALALVAALSAAEVSAAKTVWLCKPGMKDNPCMPSLSTAVFSPSMQLLRTENVKRVRRPKFDCFYVYPTVSDQPAPEATKRIDPELRSIALYQASRYSRDCRVYVPVYRQITIAGLQNPDSVTAAMQKTVYRDVREAWHTYLRKHNHGRGIVLIGHSQGTFVLRQLVRREIDSRPAIRHRLISALLLGGGVTVKKGHDRGGDFRNIRACRSAKQVGCVIAFSTFNAPVPANSIFGRAARPDLQVLCTNPAALAGGTGRLNPIYPVEPFAPGTAIGIATLLVGAPVPDVDSTWISAPGSYTGRCSHADGANVLQISPVDGAPVLRPIPDATWGLHLADGEIALGNLTDLVRHQARNYLHRRG